MKLLKIGLFTFCISPFAHADCFNTVGRAFGISPVLLKSIAIKESGMNPAAVNLANRNHTQDICMMQINSTHFAHLARLGISPERLLLEPCTCVSAGAWVLYGLFQHYGRSWNTVGMYNAGSSPARLTLRMRYAREIKNIYIKLQQKRNRDQSEALAERVVNEEI
ncbi:lytic transglycosylase domain-containing protein [Kosakonia oryzae]|uniref:lytic transglycosylase domain-containing protein n=1 Tax=Kosakonia oryzae TaxID=497725 RepID=UPI001D09839F|nr:lytic transglycosylase domain-containing protein [Kosakonia oryzae]UDJ85001.1 lytic transglycosylase domain-containing protein [Kosakonia oryzae]